MELNNENKAKFFAQYWGQKVWIVALNGDRFIQKVCASYMTKYSLKHRCLLLKPLSSITEEDAIEVAKILDWFALDFEGNIIIEHIDQFKLHFLNQGLDCDYYGIYISSQVIDYLRSKGYALPWMGMSVEDQVKAGWIKLINQ